MKIYAPVEDATGIWASVKFVDGVGETDNPDLINWFRSHGYRIETETTLSLEESAPNLLDIPTWAISENEFVEKTEPDFDSMTPNELREWGREHGLAYKIRNIRNKEKLLEIIKGGD